MTRRRDRIWLRMGGGALVLASLSVAAPVSEPVVARPLNPFQSLRLPVPDLVPKRRAAPRPAAPVQPGLPLRKPEPPESSPGSDAASDDTQAPVAEKPAADEPSTASKETTAETPAPTDEAFDPVAEAAPPTEGELAAPAETESASAQASPTEDAETDEQHTDEIADASEADKSDEPVPEPRRNPVRTGADPDAAMDPRVVAALEQCETLLDGLDLEYEHLDPIRRGACGTTAPIKLKSIGNYPKVTVSPPATVNCTVAATLHKWFETSVQPTAQALGTSVTKIKNAASYMCRNQYGRPDTKLSEHAKANALDIKAFVLASGQTIPILGNWPYGYAPERPRQAEAPWPNPLRDHSTLPPPNRTPGLIVMNEDLDYKAFTKEADEFGKMTTHPFFKPVFAAPNELPELVDEEPEGPVPEGNLSSAEAKSFLKTIHGDACKIFWTVLGPEANAAHRDHFHLDMRKRRYVKICQ